MSENYLNNSDGKYSPTGNYSLKEIAQILEKENKLEVERLIPIIVYLVVISVTGIIGNSLVCYIYYPQCNTSSSRWFIFFIAVVDLLLCVTVIPIEISTTWQQLNFKSAVFCKCSIFIIVWTSSCLALVLLFAALDRYRKVCVPTRWQINTYKSKMMCAFAAVLTFVLSVPVVFVYNIHTLKLKNFDIHGSQCSFKKENDGFSFKLMYAGFLMLLFMGTLWTICVLYCSICVAIHKHVNKKRTNQNRRLWRTGESSSKTEETCDTSTGAKPSNNETKSASDKKKSKFSKGTLSRRSNARKATLCICLISLGFVICYLPYIILLLLRNTISKFRENMSDQSRIVYEFFLRTSFLSNAINPFVYGFSDSNFRERCNQVIYSLIRLLPFRRKRGIYVV